MGQSTPPATVAAFKAQYDRDFTYGPGLDQVRDTDIQKALNAASSMFNPALFDTTPLGTAPVISSESLAAYLSASAHFLVTALQAAGGLGAKGRGVFSQGEGVVSSKGAGGINVGFSWPSVITDSPALFQFSKTTYGQQYLQYLMPRLVGNVGVAGGEQSADVGSGTTGLGPLGQLS